MPVRVIIDQPFAQPHQPFKAQRSRQLRPNPFTGHVRIAIGV